MPYTSYDQVGLVAGAKYDSGLSDAITLFNSTPQAQNLWTLTVAADPDPGDEFVINLEGLSVEYTADADDDEQDIADALLALLQEQSILNGLAIFATATNGLTIRARNPGVALDVSVNAGITAVQTTAAAAAASVPFGRAIVRVQPGDYTEPGYAGQGRLPSAAGDITGGHIYIAECDPTVLQSGLSVPGYPPNSAMTCGRDGRWVVECETAVAPGDPVYVRHTANGALNKIGAFANASGTGLALYGNAVWHKPSVGGLAVIQLNP